MQIICSAEVYMSVFKQPFGLTADGEIVTAYRIINNSGMTAVFLNYGATIQSLFVPNKQGDTTDVVLGYDNIDDYQNNGAYLGATMGRFVNRIGGAEFSLNGKTYKLCKNDGENHAHGGLRGFDKRVWDAECGEDYVRFSRLSPDGEENYPGNLQVSVTYKLTDDNTLHIIFDADTDADTILNLTNHAYFNLNGGGSVYNQELAINAERITTLGPGTMPDGRFMNVEGTPFDFRRAKPIGQDIDADDEQLKAGSGYDHNFVLSGSHAASAYCGRTGIRMDTFTDQPGMQLYTANFLDPRTGKLGAVYKERDAFCLETQIFPNPMKFYGFPSPVLRAGMHFHSETAHKFSVID